MKKTNLNTICHDCTRCGNDCKGTTEKAYTGCIYKKNGKPAFLVWCKITDKNPLRKDSYELYHSI